MIKKTQCGIYQCPYFSESTGGSERPKNYLRSHSRVEPGFKPSSLKSKSSVLPILNSWDESLNMLSVIPSLDICVFDT